MNVISPATDRAIALPGEMASLNVHPEKAGRGITDAKAVVRVTEGFVRELQALVRWKIRCLFLYGTDDIEYQNFKLVERSLLEQLPPADRARIMVDVWPGRVHIAEDPDRMRAITERGLWWIDSFRKKPFTHAQAGAPYGLRT